MPSCEFGERQYEFCANYELQANLGAYLVGGLPAIPTQAEEALRGYDAAYAFRRGKVVFIQYKVAHYSPRPHGTGASTYRLWRRAYFRARLHQDGWGHHTQHNILVGLASPPASAFYVAPGFHRRQELRAAFARGAGTGVLRKSLFASVAGLPQITDRRTHSLTYPRDLTAFRLHSEETEPFEAFGGFSEALDRTPEAELGPASFSLMRDRLRELVARAELPPPEPPTSEGFDGPLAEIGAVLDQRVGAALALFPNSA